MVKSTCLIFAQKIAQLHGLTYAEATKKFPRGFNSKSVYLDGVRTHEGHCVHCARAEAMSKNLEVRA